MISMDVFKQDAFSATSLVAAVDKIGFVPQFLGSLPGLFDPAPVRSKAIWIEARGTEAALIQSSERGSPVTKLAGETRTAQPFATFRLAKESRIHASELFAIRQFGSETETKQVADEVNRRIMLIRRDMDLTIENLKLGCVMGKVLDADASTIIDWEAALGQTIPVEVDFDLDNASPASGVLAKKCATVIRSIMRGLKGLGGGGVQIIGIAGDAFFDDFVAHPEWREWQISWPQASNLTLSKVFREITFGNITFVNYRSTDDGTTVGVNTDKCKFFPVGAGIFKWAMSPGESFADLETGSSGQPFYPRIDVDPRSNPEWADVGLRSYPLPVCTMPQALYRAKRT